MPRGLKSKGKKSITIYKESFVCGQCGKGFIGSDTVVGTSKRIKLLVRLHMKKCRPVKEPADFEAIRKDLAKSATNECSGMFCAWAASSTQPL